MTVYARLTITQRDGYWYRKRGDFCRMWIKDVLLGDIDQGQVEANIALNEIL